MSKSEGVKDCVKWLEKKIKQHDENNQLVKYKGKKYEGFYISYNNHDRRIYGDATTALVLGQMQEFFILKGNHTKQYNELIEKGFEACLQYYIDNADQHSKI